MLYIKFLLVLEKIINQSSGYNTRQQYITYIIIQSETVVIADLVTLTYIIHPLIKKKTPKRIKKNQEMKYE